MVGKNAGPTLSRLWTKVYGTVRRCRSALVVSNAYARLRLVYIVFRSEGR